MVNFKDNIMSKVSEMFQEFKQSNGQKKDSNENQITKLIAIEKNVLEAIFIRSDETPVRKDSTDISKT